MATNNVVISSTSLEEEYSKYEKMDERTLFIDTISTSFGLTKNIDLLIHSLYWCKSIEYDAFPTNMHLAHQHRIKKILDNNFSPSYLAFRHLNDDSRENAGGHYNTAGRTGFMSSLLINCSFILYDYFLQHGVEANIWDDSFVIFIKFININLDRMPIEEKAAIKSIFRQYKKLCPTCIFVNGSGLDRFISMYNRWAGEIINKEWYKKYNGRYDFNIIIENNKDAHYREIKSLLEQDKKYYRDKNPDELIFNSKWEYYPEYYNQFHYKQIDISPNFLTKIKDFLIFGENTYKSKYLKYKTKYLALKKLFEDQS
jgi:hypothetical protein